MGIQLETGNVKTHVSDETSSVATIRHFNFYRDMKWRGLGESNPSSQRERLVS
jgi:hypothetical protein